MHSRESSEPYLTPRATKRERRSRKTGQREVKTTNNHPNKWSYTANCRQTTARGMKTKPIFSFCQTHVITSHLMQRRPFKLRPLFVGQSKRPLSLKGGWRAGAICITERLIDLESISPGSLVWRYNMSRWWSTDCLADKVTPLKLSEHR